MAVKIFKKAETETASVAVTTAKPAKQAKPGQARRLPINDVCFDKPQRLRTGHLLTIFQVSAPQLYKMRVAKKVPEPAGYMGTGKRPTPYWITTELAPFI